MIYTNQQNSKEHGETREVPEEIGACEQIHVNGLHENHAGTGFFTEAILSGVHHRCAVKNNNGEKKWTLDGLSDHLTLPRSHLLGGEYRWEGEDSCAHIANVCVVK